MLKAELRRTLIHQRLDLTEETIGVSHSLIKGYLLQHLKSFAIKRIGSYMPIQGEIDLGSLESHLSNIKFYFPKVINYSSRTLGWGQRPLVLGFKGIYEPETIIPDIMMDLILVPCIGFNEQGYRLGYGGGFYDSYLNQLDQKPYLIGTAYEFSKVSFTTENHDHKLDAIVTELGITCF